MINQENIMNKEVILFVNNLKVIYGERKKRFMALNQISFKVHKGETFGIVGESGSGKTTVAKAIMRMIPISLGDIYYKGKGINGRLDRKTKQMVTNEIQMIFQDPMASLNERAKVNYIVSEGLYQKNNRLTNSEIKALVEETLISVGLTPECEDRFPHEFSGGQCQRIGIARALIMNPELIIADEPLSALDVSVRAQIINLLLRLQRERGITYLLISHDLSVMRLMADYIAVIYKGAFVELAKTEDLFMRPLHPYTKSLLSAMPIPDPRVEKNKVLIPYHKNIHDYSIYRPMWVEIMPEHYVQANVLEVKKYKEMLVRKRIV